jgi:hypothetical protein
LLRRPIRRMSRQECDRRVLRIGPKCVHADDHHWQTRTYGLADEDRARLLEPPHKLGVLIGNAIVEDFAGRRCPHARRIDAVFQGDRNTVIAAERNPRHRQTDCLEQQSRAATRE